MLKSKPIGKPARLSGSGRKFIRAFPETNPIDDNECMKSSKDIWYGLAIFKATFGCDDVGKEPLFHGFSPHEIRLASDKSKIRNSQVEKEHKARGVLFTPHSNRRNQLLSVSTVRPTSKNIEHSKIASSEKKKDSLPTNLLSKPSNVLCDRTKKNSQAQRIRPIASECSNARTDCLESNRSIAKTFVLPIRSAHSSRVIKPNKRFRDADSESTNKGGPLKKMKLSDETSNDSIYPWGKETTDKTSSDNANYTTSISFSNSTAGNGMKKEEVGPTKSTGKIILRKAKLKIEPQPPVKGPFSSGEGALVPQKVVCGVCSAVRYYRHILQTRKFGIYSCESCRKFITRTISQQSYETLCCRSGMGDCVVPQYQKDPVTGIIDHNNQRCKACWLKLCLHCYCMPPDLAARLTRRLPAFMRSDLSYMPEPKKNSDRQKENKLSNFISSSTHSRSGDKTPKKQISSTISTRRNVETNIGKRTKTLEEMSSSSGMKNNVVLIKSQHRAIAIAKKIKSACRLSVSEMSKIRQDRIRGMKSVELNLKKKMYKKGKLKREDTINRLNKISLKGPRVKHVCRSASLALGQPVAKFSDNSTSKQASSITRKEIENVVIPGATTASKSQIDDPAQFGLLTIANQNLKVSDTINNVYDLQQIEKSKHLARTLQDLTRQHYELENSTTVNCDNGLVTIDFWKSYDPEEVNKTGFALIGVREDCDARENLGSRITCFICGSAGLDRMVHCVCCCEPYHRYCLDGTTDADCESDVDGDWWLVDWVCARCSLCHTCGRGGGTQVACQKCRKSFHSECLVADRQTNRLHSADRPWVCLSCLCCKSCNQSEVYKFVGNLPLCRTCFKLRQKGNFCPLCQSCYDENDFDTKMMECEQCKCWVHAKCEGLSNEKYQILSILPESVEFVCRKCCENNPAPWWLEVEKEMKAGFLAVLKSLSKNRKACELLKCSPTKRSSMCICAAGLAQKTLRFPDLSEQSDAESLDPRLYNEGYKENNEVVEECLKSVQDDVIENHDNLACDSKLATVDRPLALNELKTKYNVRECSVVVKNNFEQLKLDTDAVSYQATEEKLSQFSPHATSQSDSGIGSTDDELKSNNDQCLCHGLEPWNKTPPTLLNIKKKVNSNEYSSLNMFNQEMEEIITNIEDTELPNLYYQTLEDIFPWFNPKCSEVNDCNSRNNNHNDTIKSATGMAIYADKPEDSTLEDVKVILKGKLNKALSYYYDTISSDDTRTCMLCKQLGEGKPSIEGRLLYCGQNEWVHTNCALWSNEVYEEIDGSLQNVQNAISRSRHIRCSKCNNKGASIGCCNRNCPETYHFICARNSNCVFFEDKSLFCFTHKNNFKESKLLISDSDFLVSRPFYVEIERKKKKYVAHHKVHLTIGSLIIGCLGEFVPELSDQECSIIPCNFQCTRLFWSSVEPWRLVQYNIKTKVVYTVSEQYSDDEYNFTIDHSLPVKERGVADDGFLNYIRNNGAVRQVIDHILDVVCLKDDEDPQSSADLFPPEVKEAIFEDLPFDFLDSITMQDIIPKLINFDSSVLNTKLNKESKTVAHIESKSQIVDSYNHAQSKLTIKCFDISESDQQGITLRKNSRMYHHEIDNKNENVQNSNSFSSTKILQVDGAGDCSSTSSGSSSSGSNCSSPVREDSCCWKLGQVDGAMDSELEDPVKCKRCHRTYRTAQSFDRHLESCSAEYILSCGESDSSEEDKISSPEEKDITLNISRTENNENLHSCSSTITDKSTTLGTARLHIDLTNRLDSVITEKNSHKDDILQQVTEVDSVSTSDISHSHLQLSIPNNTEYSTTTLEHAIAFSTDPTVNTMNQYNESHVLPKSSIKMRPVKTYARKKRVNTCTTTASSALEIAPAVDYQPPPTLIIQQVPAQSPLGLPTFIESLPHNTNSTNTGIQYHQYITVQEKPQIPMAIQLQPQLIQPVIPTVLGTLVQSNGLEQLVVNTAHPPTQSVLVTQPLYVNMESVLSSSHQLLTSYSTSATTQLFHTAKPMVPWSQTHGYVVVNTHSSTAPAPVSQPVIPTHLPEPVTNNYQETFSVKETTTYQQITRQIIHKENNAGCKEVISSYCDPIFIEEPFVQEVTVEKTRSIHKSRSVPKFQSVINSNTVIVNSNPNLEQHSQKLIVGSFSSSGISCNSLQQTKTLKSDPVFHSKESTCTIDKESEISQKQFERQTHSESITNSMENQVQLCQNYKQIVPVTKVIDPKSTVQKCYSNSNLLTTSKRKDLNEQNFQKCYTLEKNKSGLNTTGNATFMSNNSENGATQNHSKNKTTILACETKTSSVDGDSSTICENNCKTDVFEKYVVPLKQNLKITKETTPKCMLEEKRVPLKENKAIHNKAKSSSGVLVKNRCVTKLSLNADDLSNAKLVYEISSREGFSICSQDLVEAWQKVYEAVQLARAAKRLPPMPQNPFISHLRVLGLDNNSVKYLIEQLPGVRHCTNYKPAYHKSNYSCQMQQLRVNPTGCARSEPYTNTRRKYDMFSWLASRHRRPPKLVVNSETEMVNGISRRPTSLSLPMAMRFRHLKETSKEAVGVFRSDIHGRGLFCLRDIESGEMVIEYAGEVIRAGLTDKREHYYTSKGIGCYMFRIDDQFVVDATMNGNAARFINHSCEPNCYSRVVDILGKKHILIFALRKIPQGEELTYDYKFPLEDDKITCHCLSRKCRKYLN